MAFDLKEWANVFKSELTVPVEPRLKEFFELLSFEDSMIYQTDVPVVVKEHPLLAQFSEEFGYRIAMSRAKMLGREMSPRLAVLLMMLLRSPGEIVMYISALHALYPEDVLTASKLHLVTNFKLLSEDAYSTLWDMQKGAFNGEPAGIDNCLDHIR